MREIVDDAVVIDGELVLRMTPRPIAARGVTIAPEEIIDPSPMLALGATHARGMNRRDQALSGGEQPLRHFASCLIVAEGHDHRVMGDVSERRTGARTSMPRIAVPDEAGRIVDEADGLGIGARLARALQNVGDDGSLASGRRR